MTDDQPFADVRAEPGGFSLPELKWRELLFIRALRSLPDGGYERDTSRPMPPFAGRDPFPAAVRFRIVERRDGRVVLTADEPS